MDLSGIISAIVTPFSPDGEAVDRRVLKALTEAGIKGGLNGILPCGGTGEFSAMNNDERRSVLEVVLEQAGGRIPVVAQIGANSTREAVELARHAERAGAAALMLATPSYEPIDAEQVTRFFGSIAAVTDLPLCIYNYPAAMGVRYDEATVAELVRAIPTIRYLKDSSGDLGTMVKLASGSPRIGVFCGDDLMVLPALLQGCSGLINGAANFLSPAMARMAEAARGKDFVRLIDIWSQIEPLVTEVSRGHYNSNIKIACEILGFAVGPTRKPYGGRSPDRVEAIRAAVSRLDPDTLIQAV